MRGLHLERRDLVRQRRSRRLHRDQEAASRRERVDRGSGAARRRTSSPSQIAERRARCATLAGSICR
jgi:hypothetical protein